MSVRALLAYPQMPSTFWSMDEMISLTGRRASYPPLGLLTVAALLPPAWDKRLVDLNVRALTDDDLRWADLVFVGAMNVQAASARRLLARCRQAGVRVVAGGPLFTHEHHTFDGVDHFVLNEAEVTLPAFLADLEGGQPRHVYASPAFADVRQTPIPLWELADLSHYAYGIVQYSRGCPYQCDFCDVTVLFGRQPRTKSAPQIMAELDALGDLGRFDLILFADDNLIGNRRELKQELLPALARWRQGRRAAPGFATQVTVNLVDDGELMQLMLEAGFRHIFIGLETPEVDSLIACKKKQNTRRDLAGNVRQLQGAGFIVTAGLILGFDTDSPSVFQRQIDFVQDCGIVLATVNLLKAPPGTELHDRMQLEGRLTGPFDFDESRSNIVPMMDAQVLRDGYRKVLEHIYDSGNVYRRAKALLAEPSAPNVVTPVSRGVHLRDFATLARIVLRIGILGAERVHFWKLLLWTLVRRPRRKVLALSFLVLLRQFSSMRQRYLGDVLASPVAAAPQRPMADLHPTPGFAATAPDPSP